VRPSRRPSVLALPCCCCWSSQAVDAVTTRSVDRGAPGGSMRLRLALLCRARWMTHSPPCAKFLRATHHITARQASGCSEQTQCSVRACPPGVEGAGLLR
jgi:hypothetical protein